MSSDSITPSEVWSSTFPHLVPVIAHEWLPGLFLRCDESNGWLAGTTAGHCVGNPIPNRTRELILGSRFHLQSLATALSLSVEQIVTTTFVTELTQLFATPAIRSLDLGQAPPTQICPLCFQDGLSLQKHLAWPHILHCPLHHVELCRRCVCGSIILFYPRGSIRRNRSEKYQSPPFTCYRCDRSWRALPTRPGQPAGLQETQRYAAVYGLLFNEPTHDRYRRALFVLTARRCGWDEKTIMGGRANKTLQPFPYFHFSAPSAVASVVRQLVKLGVSSECIQHAPIPDAFVAATAHSRSPIANDDQPDGDDLALAPDRHGRRDAR